jgi:WD40 repeat protein
VCGSLQLNNPVFISTLFPTPSGQSLAYVLIRLVSSLAVFEVPGEGGGPRIAVGCDQPASLLIIDSESFDILHEHTFPEYQVLLYAYEEPGGAGPRVVVGCGPELQVRDDGDDDDGDDDEDDDDEDDDDDDDDGDDDDHLHHVLQSWAVHRSENRLVSNLTFCPRPALQVYDGVEGGLLYTVGGVGRALARPRVSLLGGYVWEGKQRVVVGLYDGGAVVCDPEAGVALRLLAGDIWWTNHIACFESSSSENPRPVVVLACDDRTLALWDAEEGRLLRRLAGHSDRVRTVAVYRDQATGRDRVVTSRWVMCLVRRPLQPGVGEKGGIG